MHLAVTSDTEATYRRPGKMHLEVEKAVTDRRILPEEWDGITLRALVVEPDWCVRQTLEAILSDLGMETVAVGDEATAIALLGQPGRSFDLAVVNLTLAQGASGARLARRITIASNAAIVLISGDPERLKTESARSPGAVCLEKPFGRARLAVAVALALAHKAKSPAWSTPC